MTNNADLRRLLRLIEGDQKVTQFDSDPSSTVALSTTQAAIQIGYTDGGGEQVGFVPPGYGELRLMHLDLTNVAGGATTATCSIAKGTSSAASVIVTDAITANILANPSGSTWAVNIAFPPNPIWKDDDEFYYVLVTLDAGTADATASLVCNCFRNPTVLG